MNDQIHNVENKHRPVRFVKTKWVQWVLSIFLLILLVGIGVLINYHVDKVIIEPGTAEEVGPKIEFQRVRTFTPEGTIRFLTVYVSVDRPSLAEYLKARYFDNDAEIHPWKEINGEQTPQESEDLNEALMKQSQNIAMVVALEKLGCEVKERGRGALITEVQKGSPASGFMKPGDVITAVDNKPIRIASDLADTISTYSAGDVVTISRTLADTDIKKTNTVKLAGRDDASNKGFLGVGFLTYKQSIDFPIDISIRPGDVSGPSAGLAFTLSIIDQLTKGELTGGKDIAVTGEISVDGSVSKVGGIRGKTVTARNAGAQLLLVPKGEGKLARERAGSMKVIEIDSLDDALSALEKNGGDPIEHMQTCPT